MLLRYTEAIPMGRVLLLLELVKAWGELSVLSIDEGCSSCPSLTMRVNPCERQR